MTFEPRPPNFFPEFIHTYYERCRAVCPQLHAIGGKWAPEDLIPGLSDFDARFLAAEDTTAADWTRMSFRVGEVHAELARNEPRWARILEHTPGINLTFAEVREPLFYYPEYHQWTFYEGDQEQLGAVHRTLAARPWDTHDELFQLKKFATYYGPYQRGIDPPINLAQYESKYPLHSRFMHYFAPPVQAAVSLALKRNVRGKLEALRMAREIFPQPEVADLVLEAVERHYEVPEYYTEPRLTEIERILEEYLKKTYAALAPHVTLISVNPAAAAAHVRAQVATVPFPAIERFCQSTRFSRLMGGRFLFYAEEIPWFDSKLLIRLELRRTVTLFYEEPLDAYGVVRFGENLPPETVVDRLRGKLLTPEECEGLSKFARLKNIPIRDGQEQEREMARQVADLFETVQLSLEKLREDLRQCVAEAPAPCQN